MTQVRKATAASHQLDWAIRLLLDHDAPMPAITLAGAAEGLIGPMVGDRSAHTILQTDLSSEFQLPPKIVSQQHLNKIRNWLKHWDAADAETLEINLMDEAVQWIARALINMLSYDGSVPSEAPRFLAWINETRGMSLPTTPPPAGSSTHED